jgi:pSer/pThr/pTyr-binding forkhead associated (FHA) protein
MTRDMTVIGRREDCDLRIPLGEISRKHCRLIRDGDSLRLEDLGSSNGTYLNGQRVQEAILTPGDSVQVGPVVFVLQVDGQPADDELSPIAVQSDEQQPAGEMGPPADIEVDAMPGIEELGSGLDDDHLAVLDDADTNSGEAHADLDADLNEARRTHH